MKSYLVYVNGRYAHSWPTQKSADDVVDYIRHNGFICAYYEYIDNKGGTASANLVNTGEVK